jgi:outer membrane protein assembly factor BamB
MKFFVGILLFCNLYLYGQDQNMQIYPQIKGLRDIYLVSRSSEEWYKLNYSHEEYRIDNNGNVTINVESGKSDYIFEVNNGNLIGTNHGEWGGKLIYKDEKTEYTILEENICGIINYNNEIYVLTGLSHLGIFEGKIRKLENKNGKWELSFSKDFNSSPETYAIYNSKLFIVTFDGLIVFDGNNIQQLLNGQLWSGLYPQSIYINDKIIGIGLRGCLAIINRENYKVKYYKK